MSEMSIEEALRCADVNGESHSGVQSVSRTLAAEVRRLKVMTDDAEEVLRGLAYYLSVGGYNSPTFDANMFDKKIRTGIDLLVNPWVEDARKYRALSTPEIHDFIKAVEREALHQRERWVAEHDAGKTDADWFWLIGYLAGKALNKPEKQLHHIITTAAACLNWHAARVGAHTGMRPGIEEPK